MSITFQAAIDYKTVEQKKMYFEEIYQGYNHETDFEYMSQYPDVLIDENGRLYEMRDVIPFEHEVNMSNDNFYSVLQNIDHNLYVSTKAEGGYGSVSFEDLPAFRRKLIKAVNSSSESGTTESFVSGNFYHCGIDKSGIVSRIQSMLTIIHNAQERKLGVFWA